MIRLGPPCIVAIVCAVASSAGAQPTKTTPGSAPHSAAQAEPVVPAFTAPFRTGFEPDEFHPDNPNEITWAVLDNTSPIVNASPWSMSVFYETPGDANDRHAQIAPDLVDPENSVLRLWLKNAVIDTGYLGHTKGRIQTGFPGSLNATEIYCKQRMFIHEDFNLLLAYPPDGDQWWLNIPFFDFWTGAAWEGHPNPANIGFSIFPFLGRFYFYVHNRAMPELSSIWESYNFTSEVPIGEWFTMEIGYRMGDADSGRIVLVITPDSTGISTVIFDITDITYDPAADLPGGTGPVPVSHWNPQKIYASDNTIHFIRDNGGTAQFDFDDFEFAGAWPKDWP